MNASGISAANRWFGGVYFCEDVVKCRHFWMLLLEYDIVSRGGSVAKQAPFVEVPCEEFSNAKYETFEEWEASSAAKHAGAKEEMYAGLVDPFCLLLPACSALMRPAMDIQRALIALDTSKSGDVNDGSRDLNTDLLRSVFGVRIATRDGVQKWETVGRASEYYAGRRRVLFTWFFQELKKSLAPVLAAPQVQQVIWNQFLAFRILYIRRMIKVAISITFGNPFYFLLDGQKNNDVVQRLGNLSSSPLVSKYIQKLSCLALKDVKRLRGEMSALAQSKPLCEKRVEDAWKGQNATTVNKATDEVIQAQYDKCFTERKCSFEYPKRGMEPDQAKLGDGSLTDAVVKERYKSVKDRFLNVDDWPKLKILDLFKKKIYDGSWKASCGENHSVPATKNLFLLHRPEETPENKAVSQLVVRCFDLEARLQQPGSFCILRREHIFYLLIDVVSEAIVVLLQLGVADQKEDIDFKLEIPGDVDVRPGGALVAGYLSEEFELCETCALMSQGGIHVPLLIV